MPKPARPKSQRVFAAWRGRPWTQADRKRLALRIALASDPDSDALTENAISRATFERLEDEARKLQAALRLAYQKAHDFTARSEVRSTSSDPRLSEYQALHALVQEMGRIPLWTARPTKVAIRTSSRSALLECIELENPFGLTVADLTRIAPITLNEVTAISLLVGHSANHTDEDEAWAEERRLMKPVLDRRPPST